MWGVGRWRSLRLANLFPRLSTLVCNRPSSLYQADEACQAYQVDHTHSLVVMSTGLHESGVIHDLGSLPHLLQQLCVAIVRTHHLANNVRVAGAPSLVTVERLKRIHLSSLRSSSHGQMDFIHVKCGSTLPA